MSASPVSADLTFERGLPANVEAERFVLGSIQLSGELYPDVAAVLGYEDFSLEKHRRIFGRMKDLYDRGEKIDRMMLGPVAGAAIKIDDNTDVEQGLTIGEGFETCLAARGLGFRPIWALGSAGPIGTFPVLASIEALTILRESDKKGTNAAAAQACARRWIAAGREAFAVNPPQGDMNDLMKP